MSIFYFYWECQCLNNSLLWSFLQTVPAWALNSVYVRCKMNIFITWSILWEKWNSFKVSLLYRKVTSVIVAFLQMLPQYIYQSNFFGLFLYLYKPSYELVHFIGCGRKWGLIGKRIYIIFLFCFAENLDTACWMIFFRLRPSNFRSLVSICFLKVP